MRNGVHAVYESNCFFLYFNEYLVEELIVTGNQRKEMSQTAYLLFFQYKKLP